MLDDQTNKFIRRVEKSIKDFTKDITTSVVTGTPVKSGKARSNWGFGQSPRTKVDKPFIDYTKDKSRRGGFTERLNARAAISRAKEKIDAWSLEKPGFISNSVKYIQELEDGKSTQNRDFIKNGLTKAVNRSKLFNG